jgi:hypothetical protein
LQDENHRPTGRLPSLSVRKNLTIHSLAVVICLLVPCGGLVAVVYAFWDSPSPLVFKGYGKLRYPDGSHAALFAITNDTAQWLDFHQGTGQIQVRTLFGWKDFISKSPGDVDRPIGLMVVKPHGQGTISRRGPQNGLPWRLHVTYTKRGLYTYDVYSQTMPGEPAR